LFKDEYGAEKWQDRDFGCKNKFYSYSMQHFDINDWSPQSSSFLTHRYWREN